MNYIFDNDGDSTLKWLILTKLRDSVSVMIQDMVLQALEKEPSIYSKMEDYAEELVIDPEKLKEYKRSSKAGLWDLKSK